MEKPNHVRAQGRTVDTAHLVVSEGMTRDLLYVGMTRGREENYAHVVADPPDPSPDRQAETDGTGEAEACERDWAAWNDPVLMEQRAAEAEAEAESEAIWQESRIGLGGAPWAEPEAEL